MDFGFPMKHTWRPHFPSSHLPARPAAALEDHIAVSGKLLLGLR
jgi:hypothetical protein